MPGPRALLVVFQLPLAWALPPLAPSTPTGQCPLQNLLPLTLMHFIQLGEAVRAGGKNRALKKSATSASWPLSPSVSSSGSWG